MAPAGHNDTTLDGGSGISKPVQLLVTASDDKTVRVYDGVSLRLIRAIRLETSEAFDTITYSGLLPGGTVVLSVTEAGYLFAHSLRDGSQLFGAKINMGSCEGLSWRGGARAGTEPVDSADGGGRGLHTAQIAVCGASCSVTVHNVSYE